MQQLHLDMYKDLLIPQWERMKKRGAGVHSFPSPLGLSACCPAQWPPDAAFMLPLSSMLPHLGALYCLKSYKSPSLCFPKGKL